jgi:rod shape-determining protein MreC
MDLLLSRYRNVTVLVLVICAQLVLLAYQVKSNQDVRLIRVWAITAVTPLARVIEGVRSNTVGFIGNYFYLLRVRDENQRLKAELDRVKLENIHLKNELSTADRAEALKAFQSKNPSRTILARIIGLGTGSNSKVVLVDRGVESGVQRQMAVVTPDGIVGKVIAPYLGSSQVMLITDPSFSAGVISQKNRVRGILKGKGRADCVVDYVQNEETLERGEWFYTSGFDGIFPKGFPVGTVKVVRTGPSLKEIYVDPSGLRSGLEEVLIVLEGVHQAIPDLPAVQGPISLQPPPPPDAAAPGEVGTPAGSGTDADKLRLKYKRIGEAQGHVFGEGTPGSRPPDFNINPDAAKPPSAAQAKPSTAPPAGQQPTPPAGPAQPSQPKPANPAPAAPVQPPAAPVKPPAQ